MPEKHTHPEIYCSLSGKAKSRPFKSSEIILTVKQVFLFNLPSLASCSSPQREALNLTLPEKQSWLSLDI